MYTFSVSGNILIFKTEYRLPSSAHWTCLSYHPLLITYIYYFHWVLDPTLFRFDPLLSKWNCNFYLWPSILPLLSWNVSEIIIYLFYILCKRKQDFWAKQNMFSPKIKKIKKVFSYNLRCRHFKYSQPKNVTKRRALRKPRKHLKILTYIYTYSHFTI